MPNTRSITVKFLSLIACLASCWFNSAWAGDYQNGLRAYIDGNFELARQHWLIAANRKDATSMFNLGLLHEQSKLPRSSNDKALNWYQLAADNGYAPAGYHLAQRMLERGGSDDQAISLIKRAASVGYAPARRYLAANTTSTIVARSSVKPNRANSSGPIYRTDSWINQQPSQYWTIQLLAFKHKKQVLAFIDQNSLQTKASYFSEVRGGEVFFKLVYGSFSTKDKASFARQNLGATMQQHGPWLRTWESVQKITQR
jgi:hypothetical protein